MRESQLSKMYMTLSGSENRWLLCSAVQGSPSHALTPVIYGCMEGRLCLGTNKLSVSRATVYYCLLFLTQSAGLVASLNCHISTNTGSLSNSRPSVDHRKTACSRSPVHTFVPLRPLHVGDQFVFQTALTHGASQTTGRATSTSNMAPSATHRWLTIAILAGCSAFGAYATLGAASQNGLFAAITKAVGSDVKPKSKHFPGGPAPYKLSYTGIAGIDDHLLTLISFFTIILDGPKTLDMVWVTRYMMTQFLAGWVLISLEGLRQGNKGRIASW